MLSVPVPVKLDLHPAVLIGPNLLAGLASDDGGLGSLDEGFGRDSWRSVRDFGVDGGQTAPEDGAWLQRCAGFEFVRLQRVIRTGDQILAILVVPRVVNQVEQGAAAQAAGIPRGLRGLMGNLRLLETNSSIAFPIA